MTRRIVTAKEQVELLSPWTHEAAASDDLRLGNPGEPLGKPIAGVPDPERDPRGKLAEAGLTYDDMVDNLVSHYNGANASQRLNGRKWYRVANKIFKGLGKDAGVDHARAIAVGAATSPNTDWNDNIKHAGNMLMHYRPNDSDHNEDDWMMAHIHPEALENFRQQTGRDVTHSDEDLHALADLHQGYWPNTLTNAKKGLLGNHDVANNPEAREAWMRNIQHHGMDAVLADHEGQRFANRAKPGWSPSASMRDIMRRDLGGDTDGPKGTLGSNIKKAKAVIRAPKGSKMADYAQIINGPKVRNFSTNIIDRTRMDRSGYLEHPNGDWTQHEDLGGTIDAHHLRASTMAHGQWERKGYRDEDSPLNPSNAFTYDVYNRGLLDATRRINANEADPRKHLTPKQVQAVIWLKHKADNDRFKGMPINHEGEITPRILRDHKLKLKKKEQAAERKRQREMVTAALGPKELASMPPLWRKMFTTRRMPEWTELLDSWVKHNAPKDTEGHREASRVTAGCETCGVPVYHISGTGWVHADDDDKDGEEHDEDHQAEPDPDDDLGLGLSSMNAEYERRELQGSRWYITGEHDDLPPLPDDFHVPDSPEGQPDRSPGWLHRQFVGPHKGVWDIPENELDDRWNGVYDTLGFDPKTREQWESGRHTGNPSDKWDGGMDGMMGGGVKDYLTRAPMSKDEYARHREHSQNRAKEMADSLWGAMYPPEEEEGRKAVHNTETINGLMDNGWQPEHIKYDEDDEPYAQYQHPSGWNITDRGGMYKEVGHAATPGESHDVINVNRNVDGESYNAPFGPADAHAHIENELNGDPEETGGTFQYLTENDPRIKRYKPRQASRWYVSMPVNPHTQNTQRGNTYNTNLAAEAYLEEMGAPNGRRLDFGAGHGLTGRPVESGGLGYDTFEPNPHPTKFVGGEPDENGMHRPTHTDSKRIRPKSYDRVQSTNVLNVLEPGYDVGQRHHAIEEMGRVMAPGGHAVVTVRPVSDVMGSTTGYHNPGDEPNSMRQKKRNRETGEPEEWYQKGYQNHQELVDELQGTLGSGYTVSKAPVGPVGAHVYRHPAKRKRSANWEPDEDEKETREWRCRGCGRDDNTEARCDDCGCWGPDGPADNRHEYRESSWYLKQANEDEVVGCRSCNTESYADEYAHGTHCPVCGDHNWEYAERRSDRHGSRRSSWYTDAAMEEELMGGGGAKLPGVASGGLTGDAGPGDKEKPWGTVEQLMNPQGIGAPSSAPPVGAPGGTPVSYNPSSGTEQWRTHVETGLQRNGLPTSLADQVLKQMQTESSGNPNAINNWDSNAQAGHPSQGLLQTIPDTFNKYRLPGDSTNILDPQANIDSAIGYAKSTYGPTLMNSQGNGMGSGHGY